MITHEQNNKESNLNASNTVISDINNNVNNDDVAGANLPSKHHKRTINGSKISNLGCKIGLCLDILITALLVYLAIKISLLFLISLVITVPIGIFCVIKLCQGCLSVDNKKIIVYDHEKDDFFSETSEPEYMPDQNNILLEDLEYNETIKKKPVKIVTKSY